MTNLPPRWAVKNDGSELFKNTVVKYVNNIFHEGWTGETINSWYGIYDGVPIVERAINMEYIMAIDLDVFVEEYLPLEGWLIKGELFDNQGMELINKYYRTFGDSGLYTRLDDAYYGFTTNHTNRILYYSNSGGILSSPYYFTIIQDFETIRPLLEKALSTDRLTELPNTWSVKCEDGEESDPRFLKVLNFIKEQTGLSYADAVGKHYGMSNGDSYYSDYPSIMDLSLDKFLELIGYESPTTTTSDQEKSTFTAPAQEVDTPIVQTIKELPLRWAIKWEGRDNANDYAEVIAYINFKTGKTYTGSAHSKYYGICSGTGFCLADPAMLEIQKISITDVINIITTKEIASEITDQVVPTNSVIPTAMIHSVELVQINGKYYFKQSVLDAIKDLKVITLD